MKTWWIFAILLLEIPCGFVTGMSVLSGNKTTQGQNVEGKMIFRKSNNKIYVQQELKLNALAGETKTLDDKLRAMYTNFHKKELQSLRLLNATVLKNEIALKKLENFINSRFRDQLGSYQQPGKSCADIKKWKNETSLKDGEYWITLGSRGPTKAFCDMNSDGGGWTLVSSIVLQNSNGFHWSVTKDCSKIGDYAGNKLVLSTQALGALRQQMPFNQLRFFCRKKIPGRTFDIATNTNTLGEDVIKYFTAKTNTMPKSCGSYYALPDDTSIVAKECANWGYVSGKYKTGTWHHANMRVDDRLYNHPAFVYLKGLWFVSHSASGRWECDDFVKHKGYTRSAGDFWKIFVR